MKFSNFKSSELYNDLAFSNACEANVYDVDIFSRYLDVGSHWELSVVATSMRNARRFAVNLGEALGYYRKTEIVRTSVLKKEDVYIPI